MSKILFVQIIKKEENSTEGKEPWSTWLFPPCTKTCFCFEQRNWDLSPTILSRCSYSSEQRSPWFIWAGAKAKPGSGRSSLLICSVHTGKNIIHHHHDHKHVVKSKKTLTGIFLCKKTLVSGAIDSCIFKSICFQKQQPFRTNVSEGRLCCSD